MGFIVGIIAAGAMGSAIGARLTQHGATILTSLEGRGDASRARAEAAGMVNAEDADIVARAAVILSIVPPAEAYALAARFAGPLAQAAHPPVYIDCNAISVARVKGIAGLIEDSHARFLDAGIIGGPPKRDEPGPAIYVAGQIAAEIAQLRTHGLDMRHLDGGIGAASALKLSYAGITKGLAALAAAMILAAERAGAGQALKTELAASQPQLLARFAKTLPDMYPKAYRWVDEMHSIADFIGEDQAEAGIFTAAAALYQRVSEDAAEVAQIEKFLARD
jgi:3-hydroxyisobutyrate dehydrogenase-like beta-hydroxyacid dehydrogenase